MVQYVLIPHIIGTLSQVVNPPREYGEVIPIVSEHEDTLITNECQNEIVKSPVQTMQSQNTNGT